MNYAPVGTPTFSTEDRTILDMVEPCLANGLALKRWFDLVQSRQLPVQRFDLERTFNRPNTSHGFFGEVPRPGGSLPVMGDLQEMFYDQIRLTSARTDESARWVCNQIRQFALRYFLRVSSYRQPEAYVDADERQRSSIFGLLSWCPRPRPQREGFGFSQLYYKMRGSGAIGKFSEANRYDIVDLREIGTTYEWIVLKVRIFDFSFRARPFGDRGPELVFALNEESYLVINRELITDEDSPTSNIRGQYGFGYAYIKSPPSERILAYGPGNFDAAYQTIVFRAQADGQIRVRMTFVANRPTAVASITVNPVDLGFAAADVFSLGLTSRLFGTAKNILRQFSPTFGSFDPVYSYISIANALTGGNAAQELCISREQLDKVFLLQHFMQHYSAIVGSLLTWRMIPDWLNTAALPRWVIEGVGE
jgi:hypothetical protein